MSTKNSWYSIIIKTLIVSGLIFIGLNVYDNWNASKDESYHEKKMTIREMENSKPKRFLSVDGTYNKSFWGSKIKVRGQITNKASIATYKDAIIKITYYSKTKTILGSKNYTIYELFSPNSIKKFELKIDNYKDVNSIGLDIIKASIR